MEKWYSTKVEDFQNVDEETLKRFIGKNADKILEQKFSIPAFLFAPFYAAYRKMFGHSMIFLLIAVITMIMSNNSISTILVLSIYIAYGFYANKLYIKHCIKKINKITNKNTGFVDVNYACVKKGGTSIGLVFLFLLIAIIVIAITATIITMVMATKMIGDALKSGIEDGSITVSYGSDEETEASNSNDEQDSDSNTYNGVLIYESEINIDDFLTIEIPNDFEEGTFNDKYWIDYKWNDTTSSGIFNNCKASLMIPSGYNDAEKLINEIAEHDNVSEFVSTKKANGNTWYYVRTDGAGSIVYYHATEKDGKVFLFKYEIGEDVENQNKAMEYYNDIFSSIKFK